MKKVYSLFILCCISSYCLAQSQRTLLIEECTQASCGSCNPENVALQGLLNANPGKIASIKYQMDWPGGDPMNLDNPGDANERRWYYAPPGIPHGYMDGATYGLGFPSEISQYDVDSVYAIPSPFTIKITSRISANWDSIYAKVVYKCTQAVSVQHNALHAQIVVIERHIHFNTPPGGNGETDFYNVMKKILPDSIGTLMHDSYAVNDSLVINTAWKLKNIYSLNQLGVVAYVQNDTTKDVLQAGFDSTKLVAINTYDALPVSITYPGILYCGDSIQPVVTIRNQGSTNLTSLVIKYKLNNGAVNSYNWTGNLAFFGSATVTLPKVAYTDVYNNNNLLLFTSLPNGNTDQLISNDTVSSTFNTRVAKGFVRFEIKLGYKGMDNSWTLKNSAGIKIDSGGNYPDNKDSLITRTWHLKPDCYLFRMNDAYADGINGGFYLVKDSTGQLLTLDSTGQFLGTFEETAFQVGETETGISSVQAQEQLLLYPNPTSGIFTLETNSNPSNVQVFDVLGKMVMEKNVSGNTKYVFDLSQNRPGIYFVKVVAQGETKICKIVVE